MTSGPAGRAAAARGLDLTAFADLVPRDHGLAVIALARPDGTVHASVVSAGMLPHPVTGRPAVGIVAAGGSRKLGLLRAHPHATVLLRAGFRWAAVEGPAELAGPDDPLPGVDPGRLRLLLREIFTAAGGRHDDFAGYDRAMAAERRVAVLVTPTRVYPR
jgi:PPOX class probable F420-dependent enzyme